MKDSGVQWIGLIPDDWEKCKLKYKIQGVSSGAYIDKLDYNVDGEFPIIGSNGEIGRSNKINNEEKVITTGRVGSIGTAHYVEKAWITDNTLIIHLSDNIPYKYIQYVIPQFDYPFLIKGTAQPLMTSTLLKNQYISFPRDITAQEKIINFLDKKCSEIQSAIDNTKQTIEEYKKLKQAVITKAVTKGIRENRKLKDSGSVWFADVPEDWKTKKLKFIFYIKKDIAGKEGYDVLSITQKGIVVKDLSKNEGQLAADYSNYQLVNVGDFAMNHMDLLTGWIDISKYPGVTSPDYRVFQLHEPENNCARYYLYMMQMCYMNRIFYGLGQGVSGMGRWRLQADKFLNFLIVQPPKSEQQEIADYLDKKCSQIDTLISQKEQFITELEKYKQSLIYEYVTGKKEVK